MNIEKVFGYLGKDLLDELVKVSVIKEFPKDTELIREGQFVKVVPVVLSGVIKVMIKYEEKELLLYYIQPEESCIMSFSACLNNDKSRFFAITDEDSQVMLIPSDKISRWVPIFPTIIQLFYRQYDLRYAGMIETFSRLLFDKLDKRIFDYLAEKVAVKGKNPVKISHKEIANDLGTAREVVSRLVKKLERDKKLIQYHDSIEILSAW